MKIVHVTETPYAGTATVLRHLLPELAALSVEIAICWDTNRRLPGERLTWADGLELHEVQLRRPTPGALSRLRKVAASADLVHLHGARAGAVGRAALGHSTGVVYSPHGGAFHRFRAPLALALARTVEQAAASRTSAILVACEDEAKLVRQCLPSRHHRLIRTIRHGLAVSDLVAQNTSRDSAVVAVIGRLVPEKATRVAIDAFASASEQSDLRLEVYGEGPEKSELQAYVSAQELGERVRFLGYNDITPATYSEIDVLLSASKGESFGLAVSEAMMAGCSVVSTAVGIAPEVLAPPFGFLADSARGLADALLAAVRERRLQREVPARARERALLEFEDWSATAASYRDLYRSLVRGR